MSEWLSDITENCEICGKTQGKYRCPKCGIVYCSIDCFRGHNSSCNMKFTKELIKSTPAPKSSPEMRQYMRKTLEKLDESQIHAEVEPWQAWWEAKLVVNVPKPSENPPKASPLLINHLTDILYSYCYTLRLYNGDVSFDFDGACDVLLSISTVLTTREIFDSVRKALKTCIENTKRPDIFVEYQWQVEVVRDVELCLQTRDHVFRALSETMAITREAGKDTASLKLRFFFAWAQILTGEALEKVRNQVHDYYTSLVALLASGAAYD